MNSSTPHARSVQAVLLTVALSGTVVAQCPPVVTLDDFEGGANRQGWSFNVNTPETIVPSGGHPGAWLRNNDIISFAPILTSDPKAAGLIAGDFRAQGVTRISFDARTDLRSVGQPRGFAMSILLRDSKGTPRGEDDDYAYFIGPEVPQVGAGWKSYSFDIPSQLTSSLPSGWTGGSWLNLTQFRAGVDWNDVITSVDTVEFWWIDPSFSAIIGVWHAGVDSIAFEQSGGARAANRNGRGINPQTLTVGTLPELGTRWRTDLDCSTHGAGLAALFASPEPAPGFATPFGEILFQPQGARSIAVQSVSGGSAMFSFLLPTNPALCGAVLTVQGACTGSPGLQLTNALDLVFGS